MFGRERRLARSWDDWAKLDPYWAVLTDPTKLCGGWNAERDEFFRTGDAEVKGLLEQADLHALRLGRGRALDYGCGLGRITQALAPHFSRVDGVDVSPTMVSEARLIHGGLANVKFRQIDDLLQVGRGSYDLVWSVYVLQHLGSAKAMAGALRALVALLAPMGLLVVEVPHQVPSENWRAQLRIRTRVQWALRTIGVDPEVLAQRYQLYPRMSMTALPENRVRAEVDAAGAAVVLRTTYDDRKGDSTDYRRYFVRRR